MANKGYDPLDIDMKLIPKRWLDVPLMDFEDARAEAEAIQQAELVNDIRQQDLDDKTRSNDYEKKVAEEAQTILAGKKDRGEEAKLSSDELFDLANTLGIESGQTKEVLDRELRRSEAAANRALAERRLEKPIIRGTSAYGGLEVIDPETGQIIQTLKEPEKRPNADDKPKEIMMVNPDNGEVAKVDADNPVALAGAIGAGYKMKFDNYLADLNDPYSDLNRGKKKDGGSAPKESPAKAPLKARPGYKIQRNPKTGEEREVPLG